MSHYILALETSSDIGTIALSYGADIRAEIELPDRRNHSKFLISTIATILKESGVSKSEVGVCAVSKGPGSFTGVRIGVTTAKTLAWALGWKVAGVNSLLVRAHAALEHAPEEYTHVRPYMNALQEESFYGLYSSNFEVVEPPQLVTNAAFANLKSPEKTLDVSESEVQPRAHNICSLVAQFEYLISDDVHGLAPSYLKKSSAERHHDQNAAT